MLGLRRGVLPIVLGLLASATACAGQDRKSADSPSVGSDEGSPASLEEQGGPSPEMAAFLEGDDPFTLSAEGVDWYDADGHLARRIAFGAERSAIEDVLIEALGIEPERSSNDECGAGPMEFTRWDGLTLNHLDGRFVGWFLREGEVGHWMTVAPGVAVGMTRAEVDPILEIEAVADSTLGAEFTSRLRHVENEDGSAPAGTSGLFDGSGADARLEALFSGINCFFR